jgi:hydrogenase maturation protease
LEENLFRLTVRISNTTPWHGEPRERALRQSFVSTHTILTVADGEFVSLLEPPDALKAQAEQCENVKTWPVLAGVAGERSTLLSSPIILYDYPQVAPESAGDYFDGGEIDQLLLLNTLTLTDEEKAEIRATDPRVREILERSEALTAEEFMNLHGTIREFRMLDGAAPVAAFPTLQELEKPLPQSVIVDGVEVRKGSRVRLCPRIGGDIMDIVLVGKVAIVEGIDQDDTDRIHLSVVIEDDPGRDLGAARVLGHRFFFAPEEVEPLEAVR